MIFKLLLLLAPFLLLAEAPLTTAWQKQYDTWWFKVRNTKLEGLEWSAGSDCFIYIWRQADGSPEYRLVDAETGASRLAFDPIKCAAALAEALGRKVIPNKLGLTKVTPLTESRLRLEGAGFTFILSAQGQLTPDESATNKLKPPAPIRGFGKEFTKNNAGQQRQVDAGRVGATSPDGKLKVTCDGGNVYLEDLRGGAMPQVALTADGKLGDGWVGPPHWSPDGQSFGLWRVREVKKNQYTVVDSVKQTRKEIDYEHPGDARLEKIPYVFVISRLAGSPSLRASFTRPDSGVLPLSIDNDRLDWSPDSQRMRTVFVKRGFTGHGIIEYNSTHQQWRRLLTEEDPKFVYTYGASYRYDVNERQTLWASERTGWNHLYLVDLISGRTLNAVTAGNWVMKQVLDVDVEARQVTFIGLGRHAGEDPYHRHIYRVDFSGNGLVELTPGDASHEAVFSPDGRWLIATASRVDLAPSYTLRRAKDGKELARLGTCDLTLLRAAGWEPPLRFHTKDREGKYDIWGVMVRPYPFDPKQKYPVLEHIYAGPHGAFVPKEFSFWRNNFREPSLQGFYVVQVDGRGTNNRGKEFQQYAWRNLKDGGFPDRIKWMQAATRVEPSMDIGRVGIFGGSAGGQNTVHALLLHGDFYKVGVADCGCYDNRVDKLWWNEQWLGYPVGPVYAENACATYAANLRGQLFLTVGESDTNVDTRCSYDLRDALYAAGKKELVDFEVVLGANHGACERPDMRVKRVEFFTRHLQPPRVK